MLDLEVLEEMRNIANQAIDSRLEELHYSQSPSPSRHQSRNVEDLNEIFSQELNRLKESVKSCEAKLIHQALSSP